MRPLLLDLYCGAGGAAMGYYRAGFDVVGVDRAPQPRYPFKFIQMDALTFLDGHILGHFAAIHASPPCQVFSAGAGKWGTRDRHVNLIPDTRDRLKAIGKPYVIENIQPALPHLEDPFLLCGTMFDLGVYRHRLFDTDWSFGIVPEHPRHPGRIGDGKYVTVTGHAGGSSKRDGWKGGSTADWRVAMGIDWMKGDELAEAIPPAYTELVGVRLLATIEGRDIPYQDGRQGTLDLTRA